MNDDLYEKAITAWGEEHTAQMIMTIVTKNSYNRMAVGLNEHSSRKPWQQHRVTDTQRCVARLWSGEAYL